jgi:hypothetical protein
LDHATAHLVFELCLPADLRKPEVVQTAGELDTGGWQGLLQTARFLGVAPLLHYSLDGAGLLGAVPAIERQKLAINRFQQAQQNALLASKLPQVLAYATGLGHKLAVAKGAALLGPVYPDAGLRSLADVDLLVDSADALELAKGFAHNELGYWHCDLHTQMRTRWPFWPLPLPHSAAMLGRLEAGEAVGVTSWLLAPQDQLAWACWHDFTDRWGDLRRLLDVVWMIGAYRDRLHWGEFLSAVEEWGIAGAIYPPLCVAREAAGAAVPDFVIARLRRASQLGWLDGLVGIGMWLRPPLALRTQQWPRVIQWRAIRHSVAAHRGCRPAGEAAVRRDHTFDSGRCLQYALGYLQAVLRRATGATRHRRMLGARPGNGSLRC